VLEKTDLARRGQDVVLEAFLEGTRTALGRPG
jgi:hypothetical protein